MPLALDVDTIWRIMIIFFVSAVILIPYDFLVSFDLNGTLKIQPKLKNLCGNGWKSLGRSKKTSYACSYSAFGSGGTNSISSTSISP